GKVIVEFVVSKTGAIENARVLRGRHPALDKEALRVVKAMPNWNPGRNNGNAVKVTYTLPVTFKLQQ
ncbi:MAG: energy transducer TonB, partial [Muribaculaceae bacterium]|nr:energy transducer TonB [Muribaculaceae bacterium]